MSAPTAEATVCPHARKLCFNRAATSLLTGVRRCELRFDAGVIRLYGAQPTKREGTFALTGQNGGSSKVSAVVFCRENGIEAGARFTVKRVKSWIELTPIEADADE